MLNLIHVETHSAKFNTIYNLKLSILEIHKFMYITLNAKEGTAGYIVYASGVQHM